MKKATMNVIGALLFSIVLSGMAVAQVTFSGNGNSGFGDVIGSGSLAISDDGTTITLTLDRASGNLNDGLVIYIDSDNSVDVTSTSNLTDTGDAGRAAVSGNGTDGGTSTITFPNGFQPDYAISLQNTFAGLFQLVESGSHSFVASANLDSAGASNDDYVMDIDFSEIGMSSDSTFKFVATYLNAGNAFRSDEAIGTSISGGNPGANAVTFSGFASYQAQVDISGTAGWRLLSLPIDNGAVDDVSDDSPVQGISGGSDDTEDANFYIYDDTGSFEEPTNVTTAFGDGKGFAMYFFNNTTNGSSTLPVTLDVSGFESESDVVVDMYSGATGRYTLVGNPFNANIDLANVSSNIAISINKVFWDNADGSYTSQSASGGLVIEPFQGYWQATGSSTSGGQLTFGTSDKTTTASDTTHFDKSVAVIEADLDFKLESSYNTEKNFKIQFRDDANLGWDLWDLTKLTPLIPNYISAGFEGELDGEPVFKSIESLPIDLDQEVTIPLNYELVGESQSVTMSWSGMNLVPGDFEFSLHDYAENTSIDMRANSEYSFEAISSNQQKVNPLSILNGVPTQSLKLKGTTNRFGITIRPTSVNNETEDSPLAFALDQNYPNPFNPSTTISYTIDEASAVNISVYNLMGQKVATLVDENKAAGQYNVRWNASGVASGMYYYRLEANGQALTRKMTLIK